MKLSLLSYNTLYNKAVNQELPELIKKYLPDIICLQEVLTEEANLKKIENLGFKLADSSNAFVSFGRIFGVATFYNPRTIKFRKSSIIDLNTSFSEYIFYLIRVLAGYNQPKVILKTDFTYKKTDKNFSVCNLHLYVFGSNEARVNHLDQALNSTDVKNNSSMIICGDFNYFPYRRKKLEKTMRKHGLIEATRNIHQTMNVIKGGILEQFTRLQRILIPIFNRFIVKHIKTDYIFYRGLKLAKTERIENSHSDHFPIYSTFSI